MNEQPSVLPTKIPGLKCAMNLTVKDRFNILNFLGFLQKGKFMDLYLADKIGAKISISNEEKEILELRTEEVRDPNAPPDAPPLQRLRWKAEEDKEKEFFFTKKEYAVLEKAAMAVDESGEVCRDFMETLKKILVPGEDEE